MVGWSGQVCSIFAVGMFLMAGLAADVEGQILRRRCRASKRRPPVCLQEQPPNSRPQEAGPTVLFDGKSLAGWRVANVHDFASHGKVEVKNGRIEMAVGGPETGIARTDSPPKMNYELSLEAMRTDGSDFFCGLTFPIRDEFCTMIIGGWGGGLIGLSNVDGQAANDNETTTFHTFKDNTWYKIRLRVTDTKVQAWIDDEQLIDLATKDRRFKVWWEQEPMRPLGIANWNTGTALRNITLRRETKQAVANQGG